MSRRSEAPPLGWPGSLRWMFVFAALGHWAAAIGYLGGGRQPLVDRAPWLLLALTEGAVLGLALAAPSKAGLGGLLAIGLALQTGLTWIVPPDPWRGLWWSASWAGFVSMPALWLLAHVRRARRSLVEAALVVAMASFLIGEAWLSRSRPLPTTPADAPQAGLVLEHSEGGLPGYVRSSSQPIAMAWKADAELEPLPAGDALPADRMMIRSSAGLLESSLPSRSGERSLHLRWGDAEAPAAAEQAVVISHVPVQQNLWYRVEGWARAAQPTTMTAYLAAPRRGYRNLGLYVQVPLEPAWSRFESRFQASSDEWGASLEFQVPPEVAEWELKDLSLAADPGHDSGDLGNQAVATREPAAWGIQYQFNAQGFRDVDHEPAYPPETVRVAVLGDSLVAGEGLARDQTLTARLAATSLPVGSPREWFNFGRRGAHTGDWQRLFKEFAAPAGVRLAIVVVRVDARWVDWHDRVELDDLRRRTLCHTAAALGRWLSEPAPPRPVRWLEGIWRLHAAVRQRQSRLLLVLLPSDQEPQTNRFLDAIAGELDRTALPWLDLRPVLWTDRGVADYATRDNPTVLGPAAQALAAAAIGEFLHRQPWWRAWNEPDATTADKNPEHNLAPPIPPRGVSADSPPRMLLPLAATGAPTVTEEPL